MRSMVSVVRMIHKLPTETIEKRLRDGMVDDDWIWIKTLMELELEERKEDKVQ